jgi:hypothetical protein
MANPNVHLNFSVAQSTLDVEALTNGIFRMTGMRYGFMPQVMEDTMIKSAILTYCKQCNRINHLKKLIINSFIHGFACGRGFSVKTYWEI